MILVTVGSQLPFDRMVRTVDEWAEGQRDVEVFAQIGQSTYRPRRLEWELTLDPSEFQRRIERASVVVAHAGMGTILKAWELGKPIVVMPRRAELGEVVNDHQLATARQLQQQGRIAVALDETDLWRQLDSLSHLRPAERISDHASPSLLNALTAFVHGDDALGRSSGPGQSTSTGGPA